MSHEEIMLSVFLLWLVGAVVCFIACCLINRKREYHDQDTAGEVIIIAAAWPVSVMFIIFVTPVQWLISLYNKIVGRV